MVRDLIHDHILLAGASAPAGTPRSRLRAKETRKTQDRVVKRSGLIKPLSRKSNTASSPAFGNFVWIL